MKDVGNDCESNAIAGDQKYTLVRCKMVCIKFRSTEITVTLSEIFVESNRR